MIVQVKQGKLEGIEKKSVLTGQPYCSFLGIPYGKPPVGDLRFQAPEPAENWDGIRDATKEGYSCIQDEFIRGRNALGSEDCLFLNVHTPEVSVKKPVMVFIHGGGFYAGSASFDFYGPDYLMNYDVVYVAIQYRLHALGFLNMGIPSCPGNAGLKDQTLALKWIKENISAFGGDPDNITIFGISAGATSVHLHMISAASKGLFNKAIAQSGNAYSPWAMAPNPIEEGFTLGKSLGFHGRDPEKLIEFLKEQSAKDLTAAAFQMFKEKKTLCPGACNTLAFLPSVEVIKENAFLPDKPENLQCKVTPVPFFTGYNNKEGLLIILAGGGDVIPKVRNDVSLLIKNNFDLTEKEIMEATKKVEEFYFHSKEELSREQTLIDIFTDLYFMKFYQSYDSFVKSGAPVYLYEFAFDGTLNYLKYVFQDLGPDELKTVKGASHGDDTGYLFYLSFFNKIAELQETDKKVIDNMCSLWTNFAKTGNPTQGMPDVEWTPSTVDHPCYLRIDQDLQVMPGKISEDRMMFWKNLLARAKHQF